MTLQNNPFYLRLNWFQSFCMLIKIRQQPIMCLELQQKYFYLWHHINCVLRLMEWNAIDYPRFLFINFQGFLHELGFFLNQKGIFISDMNEYSVPKKHLFTFDTCTLSHTIHGLIWQRIKNEWLIIMAPIFWQVRLNVFNCIILWLLEKKIFSSKWIPF